MKGGVYAWIGLVDEVLKQGCYTNGTLPEIKVTLLTALDYLALKQNQSSISWMAWPWQ